jgi:D-glycero-D-manno-heptose 1,7-bisphosphate phosphatase
MVKLVIFDVDGTLVRTKSGATFRKSADDWDWLPGRLEKCASLRAEGVRMAIATNQAGVAFSWSSFNEQEIKVQIDIVAQRIGAECTRVCYSTPNEKALPRYRNPDDPHRKPNPGMLHVAMQTLDIRAEDTLMVGDRPEDEQAAKAAGVAFQWANDYFK